MTPDQCFDEMAVVLGLPTDTGYIAILDMMKKLKEENEKLKNDLRLCADGLIPHGMVGGIVQTERELRHKAEKENKKLKEEFKILNDFTPVDDYDGQAMVDWISSFFEHEDKRYELEKETEKLKQQIDYAYKQINELMSKIQLSTI